MHIYLCKWEKGQTSIERVRKFLAEYSTDKNLGLSHEEIDRTPIGEGPHGKPYFVHLPHVHFSLSHSGQYFGCAFETAPIGFDLEDLSINRLKAKAIAKRFFTQQEYQYVLDGGEKAFNKIWVRKEAYIKLLGSGISYGLARFHVVGENGIINQLTDAHVDEIQIRPDIVAAYAAPEAVVVERITINL